MQLVRCADLLHRAADSTTIVGERHRLSLVVRRVDHRRLQLVVQPRELQPHLHAQRRVEVRHQRLVEQEHLRLARDRAADRDCAAAGRPTAASACGRADGRCAGSSRPASPPGRSPASSRPRALQAERHVVVQRHVRVQRIRLEHHRDAALRARHVVDLRAVDQQVAARNILGPAIIRISVDLPQPLGPTNTTNSPSAMSGSRCAALRCRRSASRCCAGARLP